MNTKKLIGITGGIGAGKSIICSIISTMGYPVFYSDIAARKIINTNPTVIKSIQTLFGKQAYTSAGLNRPYIADIIFNNQKLLTAINDIVHPAVHSAFIKWTAEQKKEIVFNEAAILFETGGYKKYDANVLVTAPIDIRISRVMLRDTITAEAVEKRMSKQWTDEQKEKLADFILNNNNETMLIPQVIDLLNKLKT